MPNDFSGIPGPTSKPMPDAKKESSHTTYSWPKCKHEADKPVLIGGYEVYFGAHRDIAGKTFDEMDIICPLNGNMPYKAFGSKMTVMQCELQDRGGVPKEWEAFVKAIIKDIKKGKKVLGYCTGGHGRTGTFGASLIAVMEPLTLDPVGEFRKRHCKEAVESKQQAEAIFALRGEALPNEYVEEFKPLKSHKKSKGASADGAWWESEIDWTGFEADPDAWLAAWKKDNSGK